MYLYLGRTLPGALVQVLVIVWAGGHYHYYVTRAIPFFQLLDRHYKKRQPSFSCVFILASFPGLLQLQFCILQAIKKLEPGEARE